MFIHGRLAPCSIHGNEPISVFPRCLGWVVGRTLECSDFRMLRSYQENICKYVSLKKRERESIRSTRCIFELSDWHLAFDFHFALIRELTITITAQKSSRTAKGENKKVISNRHSQISGTNTRMSLIAGFYLAPLVVRLDFPGVVRVIWYFCFRYFRAIHLFENVLCLGKRIFFFLNHYFNFWSFCIAFKKNLF